MIFSVGIANLEDHPRNHRSRWIGKAGWSFSPSILTTNIDPDEGARSSKINRMVSAFEHDDINRALAL